MLVMLGYVISKKRVNLTEQHPIIYTTYGKKLKIGKGERLTIEHSCPSSLLYFLSLTTLLDNYNVKRKNNL